MLLSWIRSNCLCSLILQGHLEPGVFLPYGKSNQIFPRRKKASTTVLIFLLFPSVFKLHKENKRRLSFFIFSCLKRNCSYFKKASTTTFLIFPFFSLRISISLKRNTKDTQIFHVFLLKKRSFLFCSSSSQDNTNFPLDHGLRTVR